jgi:hypothetical protein
MTRARLLCTLLLAAPLAHATNWTAFRWESFGDFPHAVVMLPATVNGMACYVQLDTGANGGFIPAGNTDAASTDIVIGPHTIKDDDRCRAGTVGNAFFEKGTLILDLKNSSFAYSGDAILRNDSDAAPFTYVHHEGWDGGHITVPITLLGQAPQQALFDTGAALFTFAPLQQSLYEALRGAESRPLTASSWGKDIGCEISRVTAPLRVSQYTLDSGVLGHCKKAVDIGVPLAGIVGLGGFAGQTITIDYPSRKWKVTR